MAGQEQLFNALRSFAATLASDYEVAEVLDGVCDHLVEVLDGLGAGVTLLDGDGQLRFAAANHPAVVASEQAQERVQEGPCTDCLAGAAPIVVPDIAVEDRWPAYREALGGADLRAVVAVPLVVRDQTIGAVDVYTDEPRRWSDDDIEAATVLAQMATAYVIRANLTAEVERVNEQLQQALESRIFIEQAKGKLAGERAIDMEEAFEVLRSHARSTNQTVRAVAQQLVAGEIEIESRDPAPS